MFHESGIFRRGLTWLGKHIHAHTGTSRQSDEEYAQRMSQEIEDFAVQVNVHDLPDIFHYWSNKYLLPVFQQFGFNSPDDFFFVYLRRIAQMLSLKTTPLCQLGRGKW